MDREKEDALQKLRDQHAEDIKNLKNDHEKMLQTLNTNFDK
jgi:hypothetical protein